jgi:UDP-N-acetylglucosamine-lysosomal-enzyme
MCLPPVDVVYTWVNGSDPKLMRDVKYYKRLEELGEEAAANMTIEEDAEKGAMNRFRDNQELRYSLRSIWKYAPWVRNVYLVTNGQVPHWLNIDHPRLTVVPHDQIFPNTEHLPCFSSPAIESHLHRIPGLSDMFLYFNDDVMLGNYIWPDDFYSHSRGYNVYMSWDVPPCAQGCPDSWVGDKYCDAPCNCEECDWDGGDCGNATSSTTERHDSWSNSRNSWQNSVPQQSTTKYCSFGCPNTWIGDKVCDRACKNKECAFDGGDCGLELIEASIAGVQLTPHIRHVDIPVGETSFWVNLTGVFNERVTEASHDNPEWIRTAIVTQNLHTLTVLLLDDEEGAQTPIQKHTEFIIEGYHNGGLVTTAFNVTMESSFNASAGTVADPSGGSTNSNLEPESLHIEHDSDDGFAASLLHDPELDAAMDALNQLQSPSSQSGDDGSVPVATPDATPDATPGATPDATPGATPTPSTSSSVSLEVPSTDESLRSNNDQDTNTDTDTPLNLVEVEVEGVPDSTDIANSKVTMRHLMSYEDHALADWITDTKRKELTMMYEADFKHAYDLALSRQREANRAAGRSGPVYPWEVEIDPADLDIPLPSLRHVDTNNQHNPTSRRLLDMFGDSLRFVNMLFTKAFGRTQRKVPAHMPHFIDARIMSDLQARWPKEFDATSSHRFRNSHDMQFSFSYYYFLIHTPKEFDLRSHFDEFLDNDHDGVLTDDEIHYLAMLMNHRTPVSAQQLTEVRAQLINGSIDASQEWLSTDKTSLVITFEGLASTPSIVRQLSDSITSRPRYRHSMENLDQVDFYMVRDNHTLVQHRLAEIRAQEHKFICLNDDMNKTHPNPQTIEALHSFYNWIVPNKSPFELEPEQYHQHTYLYDLLDHRQQLRSHMMQQFAALVFALFAIAYVIARFVFGWQCRRGKRNSHRPED